MEEGLISGIIAEVVRGMSATSQPIVEEVKPTIDPEMERMKRNAFKQEASKKLQEQRETLMGAIGRESYNGVNLFEGTTPVPAQGTPQQAAGAMAGQAPGDAGVDIGSLFGSVGNNWNAHMNNVKKESR